MGRGPFAAVSFPRSVLAAAVASSLVAVASVCAAQGPREAPARTPRTRLPVALEVTTPDACPKARFQGALEARVRRPFDVRSDATSVLRVSIANANASASGAQLEGTASFVGASGEATRSVRGSCDEVTAALALVATTWLEAEPETAPTAVLPSPTPAAAPVAAPAPAPASRDAAGPSAPRPSDGFALGAYGVATAGLVGGVAAGGGAALAYRAKRLELRGGARVALGGETADAREASYVWVTAPLDGCFHLASGGAVSVAACGRIEPGYFHASFSGSDRSLPWLSLGTGLRAGWALGPVRLEIEGFATVPVTGYRLSTTEATIVPFRTLAPVLAAGIAVPIP